MFQLVRRVMAALGMAGLIATLFRLRGTGGVPPQTGGWREISESELNAPRVGSGGQAGDGDALGPGSGRGSTPPQR